MDARKRFALANAANDVWLSAIGISGAQYTRLCIGFSRRADGTQTARLETIHGEPITGYMLPAQLLRCMDSMKHLLDHFCNEYMDMEGM